MGLLKDLASDAVELARALDGERPEDAPAP
jgi:hypothetical protein